MKLALDFEHKIAAVTVEDSDPPSANEWRFEALVNAAEIRVDPKAQAVTAPIGWQLWTYTNGTDSSDK